MKLIKNIIDIVLSALLLILLLPLFIIIAASIKITSGGPVFFVQERCGLNGRIFRLYKFRTMFENTERLKKILMPFNEVALPAFKIKNDPRITQFGKFLRMASLDEIPQFFNILKGEMSIVGPRPPIPQEVEKYKTHQRRKLAMKPGLTCIWQVSGRNKVSFEQWIEMDLEYIDNWSLWLDFKIMLRTIPAIFSFSGQ